jgi:hypothetical protein
MQLDAEEDGEAFYKPPIISLAPSATDLIGKLSEETLVESASAADNED